MAPPPLPVAADSSLPFQTVGSYRLLSKIGGGGMGTVYLARHLLLNRLVALKMLALRFHGDPAAVAQLEQEMEAIGRLKHPHIIGATDAGEVNGCPYLVMEYIKGVDLGHLLRRRGRFSVPDACELARQTAEALVCIEANNLVHRDVKPSNLLLGQDGLVRVLDLGLARLQEPTPDREALTESGQVMGTADFIAPEQGLESRRVDIRADIYSLGCTLYALLAGKPPFAAAPHNNFYLKIKAHQELPVPPITGHRPDLPEGLVDLLDRMLVKDPAQRLGSPAEVAGQLNRFTAGHAVGQLLAGSVCEPETLSEEAASPGPTLAYRDRPLRAEEQKGLETPALPAPRARRWLLALGSLALLVAAGFALWLLRKPNSETAPSPRLTPADSPLPTKFEPGVWYPLLENPPHELLWPRDSPNSHYTHYPKTRELLVSCDQSAMLGLARVTGPGFDLEMTLTQNPWAGGVGLFFRAREETSDFLTNTWADVLFLAHFNQSKEANQVWLRRGQLERFRNEPRHFVALLKAASIPRPLEREQRLAITVNRSGLQTILWGDTPVGKDLCDPQREIPPRPGAEGEVGIFVENGSALVRSVRLRLHSFPGEKP